MRLKSIKVVIVYVLVAFITLEVILRVSDAFETRRKNKHHRKVKVLCFGDDFTFGYGVKFNQGYPAKLEKSLNQRIGYDKFLVTNFGVLEFNSSQVLRYLKEKVRQYNPNSVIILAGKNNTANLTDSNYFLLKDKSNYLIRILIKFNILASNIRAFGFFDVLLEQLKKVFYPDSSGHFEWTYSGQGEDRLVGKVFHRWNGGKREILNAEKERSMRLRELKLLKDAEKEKLYGRIDQAAVYLVKAVFLNPENIWAVNELGEIYKNKGMKGRARDYFINAIKMNPEHSRAHIELALINRSENEIRILPMRERLELAFEEMNSNFVSAEIDPFLYVEKAWFLKIFGEYGAALDELRKAERLIPRYGRLYSERGCLLKLMGKDNLAMTELRRAIEINPDDHLSHFLLGLLLRKQKEYVLSFNEILEANRINIFNADYHLELGIAYKLLANFNSVEEELNKAIYLKPDSYSAYLELSRIHGEKGENKLEALDRDALEKYFLLLEYDLSNMIKFLKTRKIDIILLMYPQDDSDEYVKNINLVIADIGKRFFVPVIGWNCVNLNSVDCQDSIADRIKEYLVGKPN